MIAIFSLVRTFKLFDLTGNGRVITLFYLILKDEKDAERLKQRNDPLKEEKRAENVKAFEQKQIDRDKREAELAKKRADSERRANENKKATPF